MRKSQKLYAYDSDHFYFVYDFVSMCIVFYGINTM